MGFCLGVNASSFRSARVLSIAAIMITAACCTAAEKFSIVLIPDPQHYTTAKSWDLYGAQSRWIRDNRTKHNIKHVIYLGDLTSSNLAEHWAVVDPALAILDNNGISYSVLPGNHDYMNAGGVHLRNSTRFNNTVGPQRFAGKPWYGGNLGGKNENNYCYFSSGGLNFLVVSLEIAPRKHVMTWANNLIAAHPNHRVIIATHAYIGDGGGYTGSIGNTYGCVGARGNDLFNECARRHSNVFLVACGHITESYVGTKTGTAGNTIYEMVVDYQAERPLGDPNKAALGNGWLRLLTFNPDTNRIDASTTTVLSGDTRLFVNGVDQFYDGSYNSSPTHSHHKFSLAYDMSTPTPYTYLNASTGIQDFAANHITNNDQINPDTAQASNGDFVVVWQDDSDNNKVHRIFVRGFDPDGNERFPASVVNTSGVNSIDAVNPAVAMCADGRFVVTWQSATTGIMMRTYAASGAANGTAEQNVISATSPGKVLSPDVAIDRNGNFVVVWEDDVDGNGVYQVRGRGFAFNYTERFATKAINSVAAGDQTNPAIAMTPGGDYVVVWDDDQDRDKVCDIGMRGYLANEQQRFAQKFAHETTTTGQQRDPDVAIDDTGRFVVVWEDDTDMNSFFQIHACGFSATGGVIIPEMTVNLLAAGQQVNPVVAMTPTGAWFVAWEDDRVGEGSQMFANQFTIAGARVFADDVQVNTVSAVSNGGSNPRRMDPAVSVHRSGRYLVAWSDNMDGDATFEALVAGIGGQSKSLVIKAINGAVARSPVEPFYATNDVVTLTATSNAGYTFSRWQGDVPAGNVYQNPVTITMNANKNITAVFQPASSSVEDWGIY
jgi:hypothetical protein